MTLAPSELILNEDGSIYHLNLLPQDIATTIITVGDPDRVAQVSKYFSEIEVKKQKREFCTHTGYYKGKRLSVISTGIGTDNIDIVLNELDALVNIDFKTRQVKNNHTQLNIIRIGTSGSIQADIPIDSFLISEYAIGFDGLLHYYENDELQDFEFSDKLVKHTHWNSNKATPYVIKGDAELLSKFQDTHIIKGCTVTNVGFYGPQNRTLRLSPSNTALKTALTSFKYKNLRLTNLEMETAGIYALAKLLNHKAISLNAILANRVLNNFSTTPNKTVDLLIKYALEQLIK